MLVWWVASDLSLHPPPSPPCLPPVSVHLRLSVVFPATQSAPPASVLGVASVKHNGTRNHCARLTRRRALMSMNARLQRRLARSCAAVKAVDP